MKKCLTILANLIFIFSTTNYVFACGQEKYLDITNEDQNYDIDTEIAFEFMYNGLPKFQQPHLDKSAFSYWDWRVLTDPKTLIGSANGQVKNPIIIGHENEYWTIKLRKTVSKGLFVWNWQENDFNPNFN